MKSWLKNCFILLGSATALFSVVACHDGEFDAAKNINRYSRDTSSGTREGFFTAIGYEEAKADDTKIPGASIVESNSDMIAKIKNDPYGIGYISLASLESSSLKALNYNGVSPTIEGVVDGSYALQRNFNYCIRQEQDCTSSEWALIQAFLAYTQSQEGMSIIQSKDGILTSDIEKAPSWEEIKQDRPEINEALKSGSEVTIYLGGSTSVEKIAEALTQAFQLECPRFKAVHNHTGSSDAYKGTQGSEKNGTKKLHIGFLSRELSSTEICAENTSGQICKDGIVAVVHPDNTVLSDVAPSLLKTIYASTAITWQEVK